MYVCIYVHVVSGLASKYIYGFLICSRVNVGLILSSLGVVVNLN